jgi:transposase
MRGADVMQEQLFTAGGLDQFIPADHPLRQVREVFNGCLARMHTHFDTLYSATGRESIPPEKLLRALMLQVLFGIRSERQIIEQLRYNMLYRWFVGLPLHEAPWDHSSFTKNRDRLIEGGTPEILFDQVLDCARRENLLSEEHFSVDGTLIRAWASQASFVRKDGTGGTSGSGGDSRNGSNFHGQARSNDTHASTTDPEARLFKKHQGAEAHLCYLGHALTENRHGFTVDALLTEATGTAEREAALAMMDATPAGRRRTLGADKLYDTPEFIAQCRVRRITPHVAQTRRHGGSAIDGRTTRHAGYAISQTKRQQAERVHAWPKTWSTMRRAMVRGLAKMKAQYQFALTGSNLMRLVNLTG